MSPTFICLAFISAASANPAIAPDAQSSEPDATTAEDAIAPNSVELNASVPSSAVGSTPTPTAPADAPFAFAPPPVTPSAVPAVSAAPAAPAVPAAPQPEPIAAASPQRLPAAPAAAPAAANPSAQFQFRPPVAAPLVTPASGSISGTGIGGGTAIDGGTAVSQVLPVPLPVPNVPAAGVATPLPPAPVEQFAAPTAYPQPGFYPTGAIAYPYAPPAAAPIAYPYAPPAAAPTQFAYPYPPQAIPIGYPPQTTTPIAYPYSSPSAPVAYPYPIAPTPAIAYPYAPSASSNFAQPPNFAQPSGFALPIGGPTLTAPFVQTPAPFAQAPVAFPAPIAPFPQTPAPFPQAPAGAFPQTQFPPAPVAPFPQTQFPQTQFPQTQFPQAQFPQTPAPFPQAPTGAFPPAPVPVVQQPIAPPTQPAIDSSALTPPSLRLQGVYVLQGDESSARARLTGVYPLTPNLLFGGSIDLTEGVAFSDSQTEGLNLNELYLAASLPNLPNLRFVIGQLDLTSYFDRNSFAKDGASQFFNPIFQTNPALSAAAIGSRPGVLVNWSVNDNIEARAAAFSSARNIGDFQLDGFAGELGLRFGNAIIRGTYTSGRDAGSDSGFNQIFGIDRGGGQSGINENDREESYGVNAEVFIPELNLGLFGRYGHYQNRDLGEGGDTFSAGFTFLDVFSQNDRLGLAYGRALSNEQLRRAQDERRPDVLELFYDFRALPNLNLGFTVQQRDEFSETILGVRIRSEFDVTPGR